MPIYEYKCSNCTHIFEVMQKVNDPAISTCPKCKGPTNKVISPAGLMFKGSGWYITDYSSKGKEGKEDAKPKKDAVGKEAEKKEKKEDKKDIKALT